MAIDLFETFLEWIEAPPQSTIDRMTQTGRQMTNSLPPVRTRRFRVSIRSSISSLRTVPNGRHSRQLLSDFSSSSASGCWLPLAADRDHRRSSVRSVPAGLGGQSVCSKAPARRCCRPRGQSRLSRSPCLSAPAQLNMRARKRTTTRMPRGPRFCAHQPGLSPTPSTRAFGPARSSSRQVLGICLSLICLSAYIVTSV